MKALTLVNVRMETLLEVYTYDHPEYKELELAKLEIEELLYMHSQIKKVLLDLPKTQELEDILTFIDEVRNSEPEDL